MSGSESSAIKSTPCFLSTLSSTSVPENEDVTLSCKISGNPKPEVTWYQNGQDINEQRDISNYEILEDNVNHVLHLFGCTEQQAGVYQIVARNCFGMAQSSAFLKVTPGDKSELYPTSHYNPKDDAETCKTNEGTLSQQKNSSESMMNKEDSAEKSNSFFECFLSLDLPEPPAPESSGLYRDSELETIAFCTLESESQQKNIHCSEDKLEPTNVSDLKQNNYRTLDVSQITSDLFYDEMAMNVSEGEANEFNRSQVDAKPAGQISDHTDSCCFNAEVLAACQIREYAKTHEKNSLSKCLEKGTLSGNHTSALGENQSCFVESPTINVQNNTELQLDRSFITVDEDEHEDDHLEYFEYSDVMTEETCQDWEEKLKFLLESDGEENEFIPGSDCDGCAYFLGEMPRLFQVSDNTVPMDATIGFCGHQSKAKEVAVRSGSDPTVYSASTLQTGMTLTVGQQLSKTSTMKDKKKYKPAVASMAIENDYPRVEEENSSKNHSALDVSVVHSQGRENGISEMKCSARDLGDSESTATTGKKDVDGDVSQKNVRRLTKVRKKLTDGKVKVSVASLTKTSKDPSNVLHCQELRTSEVCPVQMERGSLDSAAEIHRPGRNVSTQRKQDMANAPKQIGLFHGEGREKSGPRAGKCIRCLSEDNQAPDENATLMIEQQETDIENTTPISSDLKLFITEPALHERSVFTSSPVISDSADGKNVALEKADSINRFHVDRAGLVNNAGLYVSNGKCGSDEQEPCWDQTLHTAITDDVAIHDIVPDDLSHFNAASRQGAICDIPIPMAMADMQMERGKAYEVNKVKTVHGTLCAEDPCKGNFQSPLESPEPKVRDDDLSLMHEQLQKLLYEEEDWAYDFPCASGQVIAAGTDTAKEVREWNITDDVNAEQRVPRNLTEDNQPVRELASYSDLNSLLKTDRGCSCASTNNSTLMLPVEIDDIPLCSDLGLKIEKTPDHLLSSILQKEKYLKDKHSGTESDHDGFFEMAAHPGEKISSTNAFHSFRTESSFRFTETPDFHLDYGQEILSDVPADRLGQLSSSEQCAHSTDGPTDKQVDDIPEKESHVAPCQSSKKECAQLSELLLKEDSFINLSGKNMDQFTSEEHSSVTVVNKSAEEEFQEKETESELNVQIDSNYGIYRGLTDNNNHNVQAVPDAWNYSYHTQDHNSVIASEPIAAWDRPEDTGQDNKRTEQSKEEPIFTASYKVRFFTEVLLEINKSDKSNISQKHREFKESRGQTAIESKNEMPQSDFQTRISGETSSTDSHICERTKELGLDSACFPSQSCKPDVLNSDASSSIVRNDYGSTGQDNQNASNVIICTQDENKENVYEGGSPNGLVIAESQVQVELLKSEVKKDNDTKTPQLSQNQYQIAEESEIQIIHHECEEGEIEPYMLALIDSEQIYFWHGSSETQQKECQKMERESQAEIIFCERHDRESEESTECNLEDIEVEPYMRALLNSEQIYSWHDSTNSVHPFMAPGSEQTDASVRGLAGGCVITSTGPNQTEAFRDSERQNLNSSEHATGKLGSTLPSTTKNRCHSEEEPAQVKTQSYTSEETADYLCALKKEKTKLQEASKLCQSPSSHNSVEDVKRKQETVKKKVMPKVQIKKQRLEAKENVYNNTSCIKKPSKAETDFTHKEDNREVRKLPCKKDNKAPKLLKKIQAELFPDFSGNIKLCCQFGDIHEDSTITWMKDAKLLARVHRSVGDDFPVSLAIVQAGKKDQGLYHCCLKNTYGKATAEFNLTTEVLEHLSSFQDVEGLEDIEFLQLIFREDFICDSYLSKSLHGRITTEELHFGEGVHRKAFRSKVMQGLVPVFSPGHPCVLKVHNAIAYGTKNNDELVKKNYKLALQECYVQNTAREYAKIYAAETKPLEGFGEVPEIIPIFLIHRPKNNIPYATVEEELIGEFVKYSIRDGKEINFMRRDSEAGQKCCTFQHWVYEKTNGSLLVTDMQGVGMKLTDVGIATLAKGYKGFKGNCSISFIDQFKALHQCNKYCEMLGLKPLQTSSQKQRKLSVSKTKSPPSSSSIKKTVVNVPAAKKT
ncbi:alpha-protein kinase 2 [Sceloporus undulatus]|uniref:alpha-protein kinase 2 n=1 Tax=Sceloporus undulatus TaxID=8520 RepID=UPI001C4C1213|nr:alpha-protein kinase 2 [Sceloporus undulatus]XP_042309833.1 alpha-protein kinase 2 [Sceloporus undulatus]XP_042309834.1 alpha-protein kinase 2 [Sceloporus undulatus]XP_042309835.1 alpha-protein kinase 2 [Sceloporus undulatus]XP_042309836.1 alpha-protein kinase 2 [Sceloporus undulatus]